MVAALKKAGGRASSCTTRTGVTCASPTRSSRRMLDFIADIEKR